MESNRIELDQPIREGDISIHTLQVDYSRLQDDQISCYQNGGKSSKTIFREALSPEDQAIWDAFLDLRNRNLKGEYQEKTNSNRMREIVVEKEAAAEAARIANKTPQEER